MRNRIGIQIVLLIWKRQWERANKGKLLIHINYHSTDLNVHILDRNIIKHGADVRLSIKVCKIWQIKQ